MSWEESVAMSRKCYQGEEVVTDLTGTPFEGYGKLDWIGDWIYRYGYIDGAHHKQWVLDQVMRIRHGTPIVVKMAKWGPPLNTREWRVSLGDPSQEYLDWCESRGIEEEDHGVAP